MLESQVKRTMRLPAGKRSEILFQDHNMPLSWENVELRGFEPLTSCMRYKPELWLDVAGGGSTSSVNRCMSLDVARYRCSLAPRLAPLPGFSGAAPPTSHASTVD